MAAAGAWTDGLEDFPPGNVKKWPFSRAGQRGNDHFGWHFEWKDRVWCFADDYISGLPDKPCGCRTPSVVHDFWNSAVVYLRNGEHFNASEDFRLAIEAEANAEALEEDSMLQAFSRVYRGMILLGFGHGYQSDVRLVKNDREAVACFKLGAIKYGLPACKYFYGRSLIRGTGGINRNVAVGIKYLHEAGSERIGEAFFELGWLYEEGGEGAKDSLPGIDTRSRAAIDFYSAAAGTYALLHNFKNVSWLPQTGNIEMILSTERWQSLQDSSGEISGSRFSLSIASQAFLFGAAAALRSPVHPDHYSPLLILIPIIGIVLAIASWLYWLEALSRNEERRDLMYYIQNAKIKAYITIATEGARNELSLSSRLSEGKLELLLTYLLVVLEFGSVNIIVLIEAVLILFFSVLKALLMPAMLVSTLFGWALKMAKWLAALAEKQWLPEFQLLYLYIVDVVLFRSIMLIVFKNFSKKLQVKFLELSVPLVAAIFFFSWVVLLINEIDSRDAGCSDWWRSNCVLCVRELSRILRELWLFWSL